MKTKRQEDEYTRKTETKWNDMKTVPRRFNEQASRVEGMPSRIFGESVIIKRWLTWEDVSLIFFLSGPVKFKDITTYLTVCSVSCRKWWRNSFTSEAVSLLLTAFSIQGLVVSSATGFIRGFFVRTFIKSTRKECTGCWKLGKTIP